MATKKEKLVEVEVKVSYFDLELKKDVRTGEVIKTSPERASLLKKKGLVR